jgi:hypothetical protein
MEACHSDDKTAAGHTHDTSFSVLEQQLLAQLVDTIIPAGTSVGALSVGVDKYLQKLIDDCYEPAVGDNVKKQLAALQESAHKNYGQPFGHATTPQRQDLFVSLSTSSDKDEKDFFDLIRNETIHGFTTSENIMEDYYHYRIAPGHYYGCVAVKA